MWKIAGSDLTSRKHGGTKPENEGPWKLFPKSSVANVPASKRDYDETVAILRGPIGEKCLARCNPKPKANYEPFRLAD